MQVSNNTFYFLLFLFYVSVSVPQTGIEPASFWSPVRRSNHCAPKTQMAERRLHCGMMPERRLIHCALLRIRATYVKKNSQFSIANFNFPWKRLNFLEGFSKFPGGFFKVSMKISTKLGTRSSKLNKVYQSYSFRLAA